MKTTMTVKSINEVKKSNSSYGRWVVSITATAQYSNGHKRDIDHTLFFWSKEEATSIKAGNVITG